MNDTMNGIDDPCGSEEHVQFLINYKDMLETNISTMENKIETYTHKLVEIKQYLVENCEHDVETDFIYSMRNGDTISTMIKYCTKCNLTFR